MKRTLLIFALLGAGTLHAQVATGVPAFSSTAGGPETINLGNLNVNLVVPIFSKPGRGLSFNYALTLDSSVWYPVSSSGNQAWTPVFNWGWQSSYSANTGYVSYNQTTSYCPHGSIIDDSNYVYRTPGASLIRSMDIRCK